MGIVSNLYLNRDGHFMGVFISSKVDVSSLLISFKLLYLSRYVNLQYCSAIVQYQTVASVNPPLWHLEVKKAGLLI